MKSIKEITMTIITEDYVSFEISKLLKEKRFDERCTHYYKNENYLVDLGYANINSYTNSDLVEEFAAPTHQMAMKWLREVHHVACFICPSIEQGFHTNKWNSYIDKLSDNFPKDPLWFVETSDSYEEACEAAIEYCLKNLI